LHFLPVHEVILVRVFDGVAGVELAEKTRVAATPEVFLDVCEAIAISVQWGDDAEKGFSLLISDAVDDAVAVKIA
jgi:hypothetical protein